MNSEFRNLKSQFAYPQEASYHQPIIEFHLLTIFSFTHVVCALNSGKNSDKNCTRTIEYEYDNDDSSSYQLK